MNMLDMLVGYRGLYITTFLIDFFFALTGLHTGCYVLQVSRISCPLLCVDDEVEICACSLSTNNDNNNAYAV